MRLTSKRILLLTVVLVFALLAVGCSGEKTPYEKNDADNYKISVRYDANGGVFTTSTSVIVDSYNADQVPLGSDGMTQIPLLRPEDAARGNNAFEATRTGYFLVGWYAKCETAEDGTQTFAEPWDFENDRLAVDPAAKNSSAEPVLTLYAAWAPLYQVHIYDRADTQNPIKTISMDPYDGLDLQIPHWNTETGAMDMYAFPAVENKTFEKAYFDAEGTQPIAQEVITHPGVLDPETATVANPELNIYVDLVDGNWFQIYTVEQFINNARLSGSYVLHADLDFTDKIWPSALMYGSFTGSIVGNGHTISNVTIEQTNNSKTNAGMFGALTESAVLENVTFAKVAMTIKAGTRVAGATYGLLAGSVSQDTTITGVSLVDGTVTVSKDAYFGTDDYVIGTVFGTGEAKLDNAQVELIYETQE